MLWLVPGQQGRGVRHCESACTESRDGQTFCYVLQKLFIEAMFVRSE